MFISNDSNYTFGQFLANENGDDIKSPVYTKCFTDTEALEGYRFIHDPEETDPEKCVSFSVYDAVSEEATATPFLNKAAVSDLTSVMFRLDTLILDSGAIRELPFYHVIVPVENIADGTLKYLVIQMTKEVEIFPENYPYYELADTFADAEPTSADAPSGGGGGESDFSVANVTITNNAGVSISSLPLANILDAPAEAGLPVTGYISPKIEDIIAADNTASYLVPLYNGALLFYPYYGAVSTVTTTRLLEATNLQGNVTILDDGILLITGDCSFTLIVPFE